MMCHWEIDEAAFSERQRKPFWDWEQVQTTAIFVFPVLPAAGEFAHSQLADERFVI